MECEELGEGVDAGKEEETEGEQSSQPGALQPLLLWVV